LGEVGSSMLPPTHRWTRSSRLSAATRNPLVVALLKFVASYGERSCVVEKVLGVGKVAPAGSDGARPSVLRRKLAGAGVPSGFCSTVVQGPPERNGPVVT